ncbi:hypothetical protein ScPMuIL_016730 [Solemya velum]
MAGVGSYRLVQSLGLVILLFILTDYSDAKGGGRGGARGGTRVSRGGSSSSGTRIGGASWRTAMTAGALYGSTSYMRRRRYHDSPDEEPEICYNSQKKDSNGTIYYHFICPLPGEPEDYGFCCGEENREYCCTFFDDPGRLAGVIIGIIVLVIFLAVGCVFLFLKCR